MNSMTKIINLTNRHRISKNDEQIAKDNTISTVRIEEDLYSIKENSQDFSSKNNSDKDLNKFKFDKLDAIIKKKIQGPLILICSH